MAGKKKKQFGQPFIRKGWLISNLGGIKFGDRGAKPTENKQIGGLLPAFLRKLSSDLRKMLPDWSEKNSKLWLALIGMFELNLKIVAGFFFPNGRRFFFA